jgi:glycosyltransferase involved in cell wall biosynthesis
LKRIIVFGTGTYYEQRKKYLENVEILVFLDNDINKQGKLLDGVKVISPEEVRMYSYEYILLMSMYQYDMKNQLLSLNVNSSKILEYTEMGKLNLNNNEINNRYKLYINSEKVNKRKALLITNNLENSGAPRALAEVGNILLKKNYEVFVISPIKGKLEEFYTSLGMHVLIEPDLTLTNKKFLQWLKQMQFSACFVNTIVYHYLINEIQKYKIPIIWWIHENSGLPICQFENYKIEKNSNLKICVVGSLAKKVMFEKFQFDQFTNLLYGFADNFKINPYVEKKDKLRFALVGYIHPIKGQDIFLQAINQLSNSIKNITEFYIIGRVSDKNLYNELLKTTSESINIKLVDELAPQDMLDFYKSIDIVVCPSRCDTMPMVVAEGLMNHKVCIVSDNTGFRELLTDKENGLICEAENAISLKSKIEWIMNNPELIGEIGDNGRKIYDKYFSMEVFENNIIELI